MGLLNAKMAEGIIRYGRNPVVAIIDSKAAGRSVRRFLPLSTATCRSWRRWTRRSRMGAEVLVLGTAPSGGRVPAEWMACCGRPVGGGPVHRQRACTTG